jgi:uncharacterized protein YeeX (DUF496 family)
MTEIRRDQEDSLLLELCRRHDVPVQLVRELLDVERDYRTSGRRHGIYDRLREAIEDSLSRREQTDAL